MSIDVKTLALANNYTDSVVIPQSGLPVPVPRNFLSPDVQSSLNKADTEPQAREQAINAKQQQINELNAQIQNTNQTLSQTDQALSNLNESVVAINNDLQRTNKFLWGDSGNNGVIKNHEGRINSLEESGGGAKGIPGTYTLGVDFTYATLGVWWENNINGKEFDDNVMLVFNELPPMQPPGLKIENIRFTRPTAKLTIKNTAVFTSSLFSLIEINKVAGIIELDNFRCYDVRINNTFLVECSGNITCNKFEVFNGILKVNPEAVLDCNIILDKSKLFIVGTFNGWQILNNESQVMIANNAVITIPEMTIANDGTNFAEGMVIDNRLGNPLDTFLRSAEIVEYANYYRGSDFDNGIIDLQTFLAIFVNGRTFGKNLFIGLSGTVEDNNDYCGISNVSFNDPCGGLFVDLGGNVKAARAIEIGNIKGIVYVQGYCPPEVSVCDYLALINCNWVDFQNANITVDILELYGTGADVKRNNFIVNQYLGIYVGSTLNAQSGTFTDTYIESSKICIPDNSTAIFNGVIWNDGGIIIDDRQGNEFDTFVRKTTAQTPIDAQYIDGSDIDYLITPGFYYSVIVEINDIAFERVVIDVRRELTGQLLQKITGMFGGRIYSFARYRNRGGGGNPEYWGDWDDMNSAINGEET